MRLLILKIESNLTILLDGRSMNEFHEISEDPVGLFCLTNTTADTICIAIKDILIRCRLPLSLCRGQAYDRASNMQGYKKVLLLK